MQEIGYAALQIIPSFKGLDKNLEAGTSKAMLAAGTRGGTQFGDAAGKSGGARFGRVFMSAAKVGLVGLAALGVGAFKLAKDSIGLASDLNESLNAVNISYDEQAKAVKKLGTEAAESLGLSNSEFNSLAVQFSAFATTIGGKGKGVVTTLDDLTTRASDFASVMNLDVNEAATLFQSGLAGETEPLRKYGIDLSAAAVEAYALSEGIVKNKDDLTEAAKVQARYGLLMEKTSKTQGDFANTSDSLANRQRILSARWDDARAKLGKGLLPIMEDAAGFIIDKGLPAFEKFSDWFTKDGLPAIQDFASDMKPLANSILPAAGEALGIIADGAKKAAPFVKGMVDAFAEMPDWAKTALVGGGVAAFAGKKLGAGSALGSAVGSLKPIPVFVMNPGFGTGGGLPGVVPGGAPKGGGPKIAPIPLLGPAIALTAGAAVNDQFPEAMPFGEKGFARDLDRYVITADGIRKNFDAAANSVSGLGNIATAESARMEAAFGRLPTRVKTDFVVNGAPESRKQAMDLVRQYDLTPKQKRTLFEAYGIDTSKDAVAGLKKAIVEHPSKKDVRFNLMGTEAAKSGLAGVKNWMDSIKSKDVFLNVYTRRTNESGGLGATSADGSTVPKTGLGYADRHPYLLADGEEVISNRWGQADRWRPLLKQINANRMADGGSVGRGRAAVVASAPISLAGLRIEGHIDIPGIGPGYLRGVVAEEIRADGRFDKAHRRGVTHG